MHVQMRLIWKDVGNCVKNHVAIWTDFPPTFDFRLYFVMFTNGTSANVSPIPKKMPPIRPAKFCCQGKVLMPNRHAAINRSFIRARYGFLSCFQ